jgi:hypothetical protein
VQDALADIGMTKEQLCKAVKVDSISKIEASRFDGMITWINEKKAKVA